MKYGECKGKLKAEGFNHEVFDPEIPKAFVVKRAETDKQQVQKLIDKGATFSTSGLFLHTGNMIITSDEITAAQKFHLDEIEKKKQNKIEEKNEERLQNVQKAVQAVEKFKPYPKTKLLRKC